MPTDEEKAQGPGGFENFQSYFNANKGTAQKSAQKYANQATGAATQAGDALENANFQFNNQKNAGTVQPAQPASTNVGSGSLDQNSIDLLNGKTPATNTGPASKPRTTQDVANRSYTGPGAVTDVAGYATAAQKAQTAEDQLNGLGLVGKGGLDANGVPRGDLSTLTKAANPNAGPGANNFSANLIGSAGRQQFDALRAHFNPTKDLASAVTSSAAAGKTAKDTSDANVAAAQAQLAQQQQAASAGAAVQGNTKGAGLSTPGDPNGIPASFTGTAAQARKAGYTDAQIVAKYGYAALAQLEKDNGNLS